MAKEYPIKIVLRMASDGPMYTAENTGRHGIAEPYCDITLLPGFRKGSAEGALEKLSKGKE